MKRNQGPIAALFLAPYLVFFSVFVVFPMLYGLWISMRDWHVLSQHTPFVGLDNYAIALSDELFRRSLLNTAYFILLAVPLGNLISFLFAVGLNQPFRGSVVYKVAFYLPTLLSVTVVALVWRWLFAADFGLLNYGLSAIAGQDVRVGWLGSPEWVMPSIAMMSIWWGVGGNMLIYLAALRSVPKEVLEAAALDGALGLRRYRSVILPLVKPAVLFCVIMSIIGASQMFGQAYILTGGGPAYSSLSVVLYMFQMGFGQYQLGYAASVAYLLFVMVILLTLPLLRSLRSSVQ